MAFNSSNANFIMLVKAFNARMEYFIEINDFVPINFNSNELSNVEICFIICIFDLCCILR